MSDMNQGSIPTPIDTITGRNQTKLVCVESISCSI